MKLGQRKEYMLGILAITTTAILWGIDIVFLRQKLFNLILMAPLFVIFFEHALGSLPLLALSFPHMKELPTIDKRSWGIIFALAISGGILGTFSIITALDFVTNHFQNFNKFSIVAVIQKMQPIIALILARILLKEKPPKLFYFLAIISIASIYFLTFPNMIPDLKNDMNNFIAGCLALLAAFFFGLSSILARYLVKKIHPFLLAFLRFAIVSGLLLPYFIWASNHYDLYYEITPKNIRYFVIIVFSSGATAIALYNYGIKRITASTSTICELAYPASAILLDIFVNKAPFAATQIIAAIVLVLSVSLITLYYRPPIGSKKNL